MRSLFRKIKLWMDYYLILCERTILKIFNVFPVKQNRVLFHSFNGRQYSCNPRAISEALMQQDGVEIVWGVNIIEAFRDSIPSNIKIVKIPSLEYIYYTKTSRVIVCNARGKGNLSKRKGQCIIQTWHASNGYKRIEGNRGVRGKISRLACKDFSYVNSGCENMTQERVRGTFDFHGSIISGTPRMDEIINGNHEEIRRRVYHYCGLEETKKIVLYAPTYRSSVQNEFGLDFSKAVEILSNRFGGNWVMLVRMHYYVKKDIENNDNVIDATHYPDIQDLLIASDALISDYSSCIWDYSFLDRPCFLYCNDLLEYTKEVGFNHPIETWGFPISTNMKDLEKNILEFNEADFAAAMATHHKQMGSLEDGHATERVCRFIYEQLHT